MSKTPTQRPTARQGVVVPVPLSVTLYTLRVCSVVFDVIGWSDGVGGATVQNIFCL